MARLVINSAGSNHSGIYQCRAKDGNSASICSSPSVPSIPCVPTTTISRPARILVVGKIVYCIMVRINFTTFVIVIITGGAFITWFIKSTNFLSKLIALT